MEQSVIQDHNDRCEKAKAELKGRGFTGKWNDEPNRLNWKHEGLDCMIVRNFRGLGLCGYVGLPPGHPMYGKGYDDVRVPGPDGDEYPEVHGGLTYSNACGDFICHTTQEGEPDDLWWLGFDCAHSGDQSPGHLRKEDPFSPSPYETYKSIEYVKRETEGLASQLARLSA